MVKLLVCLVGLILAGCGDGSAGTSKCQFEGALMQDITTGANYTIDMHACLLRSADAQPSLGCDTTANISPSEKTYGPVTLDLDVTQSAPKAGCLPTGKYQCRRSYDQKDIIYECGAQGNFRFRRSQ